VPPLETVADVEPPLPALIEMEEVPVPERLTVCGEFGALSVIVRVPLSDAAETGVKITEIWQLAPMAARDPHVFVSEKLPVVVIDVIASGALPEFVSVMFCGELDSPCDTLPKPSALPEREAPGTAAWTVKARAEEVPPPGDGLTTLICAVPAEAKFEDGTVAVIWVELT